MEITRKTDPRLQSGRPIGLPIGRQAGVSGLLLPLRAVVTNVPFAAAHPHTKSRSQPFVEKSLLEVESVANKPDQGGNAARLAHRGEYAPSADGCFCSALSTARTVLTRLTQRRKCRSPAS